ncbi:MAG: helix-turn-helix transcriptional regulator [Victivallaceae bacterium]|nr:helix-turn-helix transcriptional regulator [Victivallaceae bacterium]
MNQKQSFGKYLEELLRKYGVKKTVLADVLKVSPQFISSIIKGRKTPSREGFNTILTFLGKHLTPLEEQNLANRLIYAKTGLTSLFAWKTGAGFTYPDIEKTDPGNINMDEQIVLGLYRGLIPKAQIEVINFLRQKEMEMIELQHELIKEARKDRALNSASNK